MYLVDSNGNQVAAYTYDPYGKILSAYGSMAEINPLRYRGYYYDAETGFYYLQSRYYDPNTCRFINADSYASTGQSYLGYNMFAYCGNNPVERTDADGEFWDIIFDVVSVVTSVVEVIKNPDDPWAWAGLVGDIVDVAVPFVGGVGEVTKAAGAVSKTADLVDAAHDATRVAGKMEDALDAGSDIARKTDFYVTPAGEAIPASIDDFKNNLSKLEIKGGKYYAEDRNRPIRIRNNEIHEEKIGYTGIKSEYHTIPHFHIERRCKGDSGDWIPTYTGRMDMLY